MDETIDEFCLRIIAGISDSTEERMVMDHIGEVIDVPRHSGTYHHWIRHVACRHIASRLNPE